ncbi:MAG: LarC family nickel insertion protein [Victivallales bacterium]
MNKLLYLEGASGISGDMTVAALLDLGASETKLSAVLESLHLEGFRWQISRKKSYGIEGCDFDVILEEHHHNHGDDGHHHGHHEHRNLTDVYEVIDRGEMTDGARELARKIFRIVAEAEAKAHGCPIGEVHFHEVGAIDSIADIVAAAVLVDDLGITDCIVTGLTEGSGFVHCQHGDLPVPVPAVLNIARTYGIPFRPGNVQGEMVTPTGIAIAAALRTRETLPARYFVEKTGIGLGKRDFGRANLLRAMILREE